VRVRFTKQGKVRFTSHRDVARILERAARRASLPLAYSEGFSPRPRLHFGLALPTGCASHGEYADFDLTEPVDLSSLPVLLTAHLPPGMAVTSVALVEPGATSLQEAVTSCTWTVDLPDVEQADAHEAVERLLALSALEVPRRRKGVEVAEDVRAAVREVWVEPGDQDGAVLWMELATKPRSARPSDLLSTLDPGWEPTCITRVSQWIDGDGARREPLAPRETVGPHANVGAS
jgi:radical SAM-linked protein